jgi:transcriptional regulator with XRE-family HTH domain
MASWNSPAVARRWLAHELRGMRDARGLAQRDVGRACGWSGVKVSYLENGQQNVADDDLDKLLPLYEVPEAERRGFYEAAAAGREKGWWDRYGEDVVPPYLAPFIGLEQGASLIRTFEPTIVPGLIQTPAYMAQVIAADLTPRTDRLIRQIVDVRLTRQRVLTRQHDPAEFVAVIDESVLRREVGGPQVMAEQLDHIVEVCQQPNVNLHIFPFERGVSPGLVTASHRILHFAHTVPPIVYMETREGAQWIDEGMRVDQHDLAFEGVVSAALGVEESSEMVRRAAAAFAARA